jgi:hypothetical protein
MVDLLKFKSMKYLLIILFAFFISLTAVTVNSQSVVWIKYGECYKAMKNLKESVKNDSVAVSMFWNNYVVINKNVEFLKAKTPSEVIEFFSREENKQLMCEHKRFIGSKVLLDDSKDKE